MLSLVSLLLLVTVMLSTYLLLLAPFHSVARLNVVGFAYTVDAFHLLMPSICYYLTSTLILVHLFLKVFLLFLVPATVRVPIYFWRTAFDNVHDVILACWCSVSSIDASAPAINQVTICWYSSCWWCFFCCISFYSKSYRKIIIDRSFFTDHRNIKYPTTNFRNNRDLDFSLPEYLI